MTINDPTVDEDGNPRIHDVSPDGLTEADRQKIGLLEEVRTVLSRAHHRRVILPDHEHAALLEKISRVQRFIAGLPEED